MKVLIVKLAAIGDVVMATPMLTYLRSKYPNVHITWVCGRQVEPILAATQLIDHLIALDERELLAGSWYQKVKSLLSIGRYLAFRAYDLVITAHADPRYRLISGLVRAKIKRSFHRRRKRPFPLPGRYHASEYLRLIAGSDDHTEFRPFYPKIHGLKKAKRDNTILIAPGGAKNVLAEQGLKRWPVTHYATLLKALSDCPFSLVLIGAKTDEWVLPFFKDVQFENRIGECTLLELLELMQDARLLITHDSGPLHLAKLVACPTLALFGPTNPKELAGPHPTITVLKQSLSCQPCYDGKEFAKCSHQLCLTTLSPQTVFEKSQEILNDSRQVLKAGRFH